MFRLKRAYIRRNTKAKLEKYCSEAGEHYSKLYRLVFREGCGPLEALEKL